MPIDPAIPYSPDPQVAMQQRLSNLERRLRTLEGQLQGFVAGGFPVVSSLPPFGRAGRVVMLASDHKLYADTGSSWVAQT